MNIILIVFDSLRKDCLGAYGNPFWGKVHTPHFDEFARQSLVMNRAFPESLPTLPARRALYTGQRVYPFHNADFRLKGDFTGAPGWGPIPEEQPTLAEMLRENGFRTALISDVYHMFKPSKNFWRGFDQWNFLRGQEADPYRSGPRLSPKEIDFWLPREMQNSATIEFIQQCIMNIHDRTREEDYFVARVMKEAALWLEQNLDADNFFLTIESFDPHEPWLVPTHYRRMYSKTTGQEQVKSGYEDVSSLPRQIVERTQANYSGLVTMCDRWFGYFMDTLRVLGLLDDTMIIVTADHGHSLGDANYMGKRGYPSTREVFDIPLFVRHPRGTGANLQSDIFVQHTDITAEILKTARVESPVTLHGQPFFERAIANKPFREQVTVAWGSTITVVTEQWWLNCKVDGSGAFLYDLQTPEPWKHNLANQNLETVRSLFNVALQEAGGSFPDWLLELAKKELDAPGCSDLAARK